MTLVTSNWKLYITTSIVYPAQLLKRNCQERLWVIQHLAFYRCLHLTTKSCILQIFTPLTKFCILQMFTPDMKSCILQIFTPNKILLLLMPLSILTWTLWAPSWSWRARARPRPRSGSRRSRTSSYVCRRPWWLWFWKGDNMNKDKQSDWRS